MKNNDLTVLPCIGFKGEQIWFGFGVVVVVLNGVEGNRSLLILTGQNMT